MKPVYRLGIEEDMSDPAVVRRIAEWYKQLHSQGYGYVCQNGESMYDEADFFTLENIVSIKDKTETQDAPAWGLLEQNYAAISDLLRKARRTITYNDFYYTNMVVAKDNSSALMFDYNLLGEFDPAEKALDDVVSVVVTLHLACLRENFPWWAQTLLDELNTTFIEKIELLRRFQ